MYQTPEPAIGWADDGSESGVIRTRPTRRDLARVPLRSVHMPLGNEQREAYFARNRQVLGC